MGIITRITVQLRNSRDRLYWLSRSRTIKLKLGQGFYANKECEFEGYNRLDNETKIYNCRLGFGSYLGRSSCLFNTTIGRYTSIGPRLTNLPGRHPIDSFVSTHPAFYSIQKQSGISYVSINLFKENVYVNEDEQIVNSIGNDVWIGGNVTLLPGISIGDGAIVAAGAVITKNVEPYTIVGGVPAKEIRKRFDETTIDWLMQFKWWNKEKVWIEENAHLFLDINNFVTEQNATNYVPSH